MKILYVTPYSHTATALVERGIKTLKDPMKTNLEDNCNLNEALHRSLTIMRTKVDSKLKETPFERQYGRKPRTEVTNYLNLPTDTMILFQPNQRHFKHTPSVYPNNFLANKNKRLKRKRTTSRKRRT